ncbi:MAG: NAD(P)/FAD-dependent oxidoreductase [Pseudomonadota bacterium]
MERVLIAGMGPAGLVAGLTLVRAGIPVALFEAEVDLPTDLRASTFHPPTLDMLDKLGLAQTLVDQGLIAPTYQWRDRSSGDAATFDLGCLAGLTGFPFRLQCEQWKLTRAARAILADEPLAEMHFGWAAHSVSQTEDTVTLILTCDGETRTETGTFLIGADGASSAVRRALDIPFDGFTYPEQWVVASTPVDFAAKLPGLAPVTYTADSEEWYVLLQTRDLWRVLIPVAEDADADMILSDDWIEAKLQGIAAHDTGYPIAHRTIYRVHQRVAARYSDGRAAIIGDAAHINNPLGGMGMNGGIHDAVNLATKLIAVFNDGADLGRLMDHFSAQRRDIAEEYVLSHTHKNKQVIEEKDPAKRAAHLAHLKSVAETPDALLAYVRKGAMLDAVEKSMGVMP